MKLSHIAFVVVAATCAAGAAQAVPQTVWIAENFSSTRTTFDAFRSNCVGGRVNVYMNKFNAVTADSLPGDTGTGNFFAYQCTFDATKIDPSMAAYGGQLVTLSHTVGSFQAFQLYLPPYNPNRITSLGRITTLTILINACPINFNISTVNPGVAVHAGCPATFGPVFTQGGMAHKGYAMTPSASSDPALSDGGFADVEDELWPQLTLGTNFVTASANVAQLFGVVVTEELYKAMQAAQGLAVGDFIPGVNQPSISADQYRSIISTGTAGSPWQTDWQPLVGPAGTGKVVNLCREGATSGTQVSSNAFFLKNPCRQWPILNGQLEPQAGSATNANYIVTEGADTGDVKTCLNNSNNNASVNNKFAIGVMSMQNIPSATDKFKFVKINGVSGNIDLKQRAAGAKGLYPFVMEKVYIVNNPTRQALFDELAGDLGDPAVLDLTGMFVLPISPNAGVPDGDKVGYGTKFGNNCQPQQLFF